MESTIPTAAPSLDEDVTPGADVRPFLTAAGIQALATGRNPETAVFFVETAGNAFLRLRAAGNASAELLAGLDRGDRVEVRLVPAIDVGAERPITEAGRAASWAGVCVARPAKCGGLCSGECTAEDAARFDEAP